MTVHDLHYTSINYIDSVSIIHIVTWKYDDTPWILTCRMFIHNLVSYSQFSLSWYTKKKIAEKRKPWKWPLNNNNNNNNNNDDNNA